MDKRFKVTRTAAVGYALFYVLFRPDSMSWWLVIGGGVVLLCIVAAIEARWQRNCNDQTVKAPASNPGAGQDSN